MREILFRGKRVDNGEWVYGFYNRCEARLTYTEEHYKNNPRSWIQTVENEGFAGQLFHVDTDTVGQYSGLKDANDVKIYEGDIIKTIDYFGEQRLFLVCFDNGMFLADTSALRSWINPIFALEVVGNIHDNPDMLTNEGEG